MCLAKKFFKFVIPSIVSMWVFSIYSMVDGVFVAHGVGEEALAAVNLSTPLTAFIFALGLLFAVGTSTVISIALGKGEREEACNIFNQNLFLLAVLSVVLSAALLLNLDAVARFLGATDGTAAYVRGYTGIISLFAAFFILSYNLEVLVKADGAPHVSTVGVVSCALMNVALDYVFVLRLGWGVEGAALATGLAQVTSTVIFVLYFVLRKSTLHFSRFKLRLSVYRRILPIGLADGITELSGGAVIFMFNQVILAVIGERGIVSYTIISYVNTLVLMTMTGTTQGIQPLVSYYYGKGGRGTCHRLLRYALLAVTFFSLAAFCIGQFGAARIAGLFIGQGELIDTTVQAMRLFSCSFLLMGYNVLLSGFFAAMERPRFSLAISMGRGLALPALCLLGMAALGGEHGIWLASGLSELLCLGLTAFFSLRYFRGPRSRGKGARAFA